MKIFNRIGQQQTTNNVPKNDTKKIKKEMFFFFYFPFLINIITGHLVLSLDRNFTFLTSQKYKINNITCSFILDKYYNFKLCIILVSFDMIEKKKAIDKQLVDLFPYNKMKTSCVNNKLHHTCIMQQFGPPLP